MLLKRENHFINTILMITPVFSREKWSFRSEAFQFLMPHKIIFQYASSKCVCAHVNMFFRIHTRTLMQLTRKPHCKVPSLVLKKKRSSGNKNFTNLSWAGGRHKHSCCWAACLSPNGCKSILKMMRRSKTMPNRHLVDVDMLFLCRPYVTGYNGRWTRFHKTVMILSLLLDHL